MAFDTKWCMPKNYYRYCELEEDRQQLSCLKQQISQKLKIIDSSIDILLSEMSESELELIKEKQTDIIERVADSGHYSICEKKKTEFYCI